MSALAISALARMLLIISVGGAGLSHITAAFAGCVHGAMVLCLSVCYLTHCKNFCTAGLVLKAQRNISF